MEGGENHLDQWLIYGEPDLKLVGLTNSSFEFDRDDNMSVSGHVLIDE